MTLQIEDIEKYAGTQAEICGKVFTLKFGNQMVGRVTYFESEKFNNGANTYRIDASPDFDFIPVPVDVRLLTYEGNDIFEEELEYVGKDGEIEYGNASYDEPVETFEEYAEIVYNLATKIITGFEESKEKDLVNEGLLL